MDAYIDILGRKNPAVAWIEAGTGDAEETALLEKASVLISTIAKCRVVSTRTVAVAPPAFPVKLGVDATGVADMLVALACPDKKVATGFRAHLGIIESRGSKRIAFIRLIMTAWNVETDGSWTCPSLCGKGSPRRAILAETDFATCVGGRYVKYVRMIYEYLSPTDKVPEDDSQLLSLPVRAKYMANLRPGDGAVCMAQPIDYCCGMAIYYDGTEKPDNPSYAEFACCWCGRELNLATMHTCPQCCVENPIVSANYCSRACLVADSLAGHDCVRDSLGNSDAFAHCWNCRAPVRDRCCRAPEIANLHVVECPTCGVARYCSESCRAGHSDRHAAFCVGEQRLFRRGPGSLHGRFCEGLIAICGIARDALQSGCVAGRKNVAIGAVETATAVECHAVMFSKESVAHATHLSTGRSTVLVGETVAARVLDIVLSRIATNVALGKKTVVVAPAGMVPFSLELTRLVATRTRRRLCVIDYMYFPGNMPTRARLERAHVVILRSDFISHFAELANSDYARFETIFIGPRDASIGFPGAPPINLT